MARREAERRSGDAGGGCKLTVTRKGVEIHAWHGPYGVEPLDLAWEDVDRMREEVFKPRKQSKSPEWDVTGGQNPL